MVLDSSVLRVAMSAMSHVAPALSVLATLLPYAPPSVRWLHPVLQRRQSHKAHSHTVPLCRSVGLCAYRNRPSRVRPMKGLFLSHSNLWLPDRTSNIKDSLDV